MTSDNTTKMNLENHAKMIDGQLLKTRLTKSVQELEKKGVEFDQAVYDSLILDLWLFDPKNR